MLKEFIYMFIFLILTVVVFYPIGFYLISKFKTNLKDNEIIVFSYLISINLFVLMAVVFGLLHIRILLLPVLLLLFFAVIVKYKWKTIMPFGFLCKNKILLLIILAGILTQGFIDFPSGYLYKDGILFWSSQGHDGLWHIALIEEARKTMPLSNPLISGEPLYNYHYLFDVVMGEFGRIFPFFSSLDLYFRFFPVFLSFLISLSVYSFIFRWQKSKTVAYLATMFTWGIGSFGYIIKYFRQGTIWGGETIFWASQGNTILGNPPHASAFALLPAIFLAFLFYNKKRQKIWFLIIFLLTFMLSGFKVSAGVTVLGGLAAVAFLDLILNRKMATGILCGILGVCNFLTVSLLTKGIGGFLIWQPWWFVRTMAVVGDRLGWMDIELRRQHYASLGTVKGYLRMIQIESTLFLIFVFGNLGMKMFGFIEILVLLVREKLKILKRNIDIILITGGVVSLLMVLLFVQKGIIYNHIQYFQYFALIMGWYTAIWMGKLVDKIPRKTIKIGLLTVFFVFSIPTVVGNLVEFYGPGTRPLAIVDNQLLEGLDYLRKNSNKDAVILTVPFNKFRNDDSVPRPLPIYNWYSTAYVPAIASRRTYLSSEEQLDITGYQWKERKANANKFFSQTDFSWNKQFLKDNNINYVLIAKDEGVDNFKWQLIGLEKWFDNDSVKIYKVI